MDATPNSTPVSRHEDPVTRAEVFLIKWEGPQCPSLLDISAAAGLSPWKLHLAFRAAKGVSLAEFYRQRRQLN